MNESAKPVIWISGPKLRERWGGMSNSTFYHHLRNNAIPQPQYPFSTSTPMWAMNDIEGFEEKAAQTSRKPVARGRPRAQANHEAVPA